MLDRYIEGHPKDELAYRYRANALFRIGRVEEALESLDRAIEVQPGAHMPLFLRALYAHFVPGSCERIRSDLDKAEELVSQDDANRWAGRAMATAYHGIHTCPEMYDGPLALELARKAAASDPREPEYQRVLGAALYRNGRFEEAREALLRAAELDVTEDDMGLFFLAMASFELGETREARDYNDRAVARMDATFPEHPQSLQFRGEAAALLGL